MKKVCVYAGLAVLTIAGAVFAYKTTFVSSTRADCPGQIICPLTGQPVCIDQCPMSKTAGKAEKPSCCKRAESAAQPAQ